MKRIGPPLKVISLGAGVQSSTMFLMSCSGDLPKADVAVFSDTQGEPPEVYEQLEYLTARGKEAGIKVQIATFGNLLEDFMAFVEGKRKRADMIPLYAKDRVTGESKGLLSRQCTREYKIYPVRRTARAEMKAQGKRWVHMWIGMSTDEPDRIKPSPVQYVEHVYPLIDRGMSRTDCTQWCISHNHPTPPRSACFYCPFHSGSEWRRIREANPDLFARAVEIDKKIRNFGNVKHDLYLHRLRLPLDEAIELDDGGRDEFGNECEGMCGV